MSLRYRSLMVLAAVLFGQLLLMAYQLRRNQDIPLVRGSVVYVVGPFQRAGNATARAVRGVWDGYVYLWATHRQNQALQSKLESMTVENQRLREQAAEGQRLQVLFDLRQQAPLPTLAAQVLSTGSSETARIVLIDKGANAGLKPDFPVMVSEGVVGKVLHAFPDTAQVLLITDPYSGVACLLEGSRVHGILKGLNRPLASLSYVPNGEDVKAGQRVLTSGEDQIYPKGLPVGIVIDARPGPEFMQVTVQPLAPLNRLEDVLVILQSGGDVSGSPIATRGAPVVAAVPAGPHPVPAAQTLVPSQAASPSQPPTSQPPSSPTAAMATGGAAAPSATLAPKAPGVVASTTSSAPAQSGAAASSPQMPRTSSSPPAAPSSSPSGPPASPPLSPPKPPPASAPNSSGAAQAPSNAPATQPLAPKPPVPKADAPARPAAAAPPSPPAPQATAPPGPTAPTPAPRPSPPPAGTATQPPAVP